MHDRPALYGIIPSHAVERIMEEALAGGCRSEI
jgi:hypothetical protein